MSLTRPMLAATARTPADIWFPCCATPKLDGIRCVTVGGRALARSFKLIRNQHIQRMVSALPDGLDGELISGDFNSTQSAVMSYAGTPDFKYVVFDQYSDAPYWDRVHSLPPLPQWCEPLLPTVLNNLEEFTRYESDQLAADYEGVITRHAHGPYLCARATLRSQYMVKYKRFEDSEARIVGFTEGTTNLNTLDTDAFGYAKRSGHSAGKLLRGTLGSLTCVDAHTGETVQVAGMTEDLRAAVWADQPAYLGKLLKYRFQRAPGCAPRFPRFICFLEDE